MFLLLNILWKAAGVRVADPGFPVGGVDLVGGIDSWGSYVSKSLYVKPKDSGPLGACPVHAPHRSANELLFKSGTENEFSFTFPGIET